MVSEEDRRAMLASKLKVWRKQQSRQRERFGKEPLTQALVAELLHVSQGYVSKLEAGAIAPDFLDLERLTYLYGKKLWQLGTLSRKEVLKLNHNNHRTFHETSNHEEIHLSLVGDEPSQADICSSSNGRINRREQD
jgi:transcriptional regulator with XRE-family HTH domain